MIKKIIYISLIWMVFHGASLHAASLLVEAESFTEKGGWVVDQQFMDLMGSPYLLAHGLGSPVENASTNVQLPENGDRKSTRLNSSHANESRMPSSA